MFDFLNDMERNRAASTALAKTAAAGMAPEHLVPGALVTMGPSLTIGDRSYTNEIMEVMASNAGTVLVRRKAGGYGFDQENKPRLVVIHEHRFYPAEHLYEAIVAAESEAKSNDSAVPAVPPGHDIQFSDDAPAQAEA